MVAEPTDEGNPVTPAEILGTAFAESGNCQSVIVVALGTNGAVTVTYSDESSLKLLGMIELARIDILEDSFERKEKE